MKILCPIDFSEASKLALNQAIKLINIFNGELHIINAYHVPKQVDSLISLQEIIRNDTEKELATVADSIRPLINREIELVTKCVEAKASKLITNYASSHNLDLIVMGTTGATTLRKVIFGSVTKKVFKKSNIPVLAIPINNEAKDIGKNIVLAMDSKAIENKETVQLLDTLVTGLNTNLNIYHVSKEEDLMPIDPFISEYVPHRIEDVVIEIKNDPVQAIKEYVDNNDVDLLVMIKRKHSVLERLLIKGNTEEELFKTKIPILMLPSIP